MTSETETPAAEPIFLRCKDVMARTGFSRADLYRRVTRGEFPKQHRLSHRVAVWIEDEVTAWGEREKARLRGLTA